jgi:acyl carrier protein
MYRSGDVARYLPDGDIEFIGRTDQQVKIRGHRIELGEVESVLAQHPAVRCAVVLAREDAPGGKHLVAYLTLKQDEEVAMRELRDFLTGKLPEYMVPRFFVMLDDMPVTANGKINRAALPAPDRLARGPDCPFIAPRDVVEEVVADIFGEVLKLRGMSVADNFFELGGHSLLATQVVSRVRSTFQMDLPLRSFFLSPSIAGVAEAIKDREASPGMAERIAKMKKSIDRLSGGEVEELLAKRKVKL